MSMDANRRAYIVTWILSILIACSLIGLLLLIVLLPLSIKKVSDDEYALNYRKVPRRIDGGILGEGRHTLQPDSKLITVPSKAQIQRFDSHCLTKDGVYVYVNVRVPTLVIKNNVFDIFYEFDDYDNLEAYINLVVYDAVLDACSNVTAVEFRDRGYTEGIIITEVGQSLIISMTYVTSEGTSTLDNYRYPSLLESALNKEQSTKEQIQIELNQREEKIISANTELQKALIKKQQTINSATKEAEGVLFEAEELARAEEAQWNKTRDAYLASEENFRAGNENFTFGDYVRQYLFPQLFAEFDGSVVEMPN